MIPPPIIPSPPVQPDQARPFWSVMIPTYRPQEAYLRQTLESVLQQDPGSEQMQIEVVDDCSPDVNVEVMVQAIAGSRVKFSRTPKNLGLAGCWNTCLERSLGNWVHILHQDDYVLPGFYEKAEIEAARHPDVAMIACRSFIVDKQGVILKVSQRIPELERGGRNEKPFLYASPVPCPGVVVRRQFYEVHGGFRNDLLFVLDVEMWARAVAAGGGVIMADVLACYRASDESATSRLERSSESLRDVERLIQIYSQRHPQFDANKSRLQLSWKTLDQALLFSRRGDAEAAKWNWVYWKNNLPLRLRLRVFIGRLLLTLARRLLPPKASSDE